MLAHPRLRTVLKVSGGLVVLCLMLLFAVAHQLDAEIIDARSANAPKFPHIEQYQPRFGRHRPLVAVVGENSHTELIDFVVPYSVLARSGAADVVALSTRAGLISMFPALRIKPDGTTAQFDLQHPEGADYVIVPAVMNTQDPTLRSWIQLQSGKGATIFSICDGALVVANAGLLKGHFATGHWFTQWMRQLQYPDTKWVKNLRYAADGKVISSAGVSAALPASLALVEAIAGRERARSVASDLGVSSWGPDHNSESFHPQLGNLSAFGTTWISNRAFKTSDVMGLPISDGDDELVLAVSADAYGRTGRTKVLAVGPSLRPQITRHGLRIVPDQVRGNAAATNSIGKLPRSGSTPTPLDQVLHDIERKYGKATATGVALTLEYPSAFEQTRKSALGATVLAGPYRGCTFRAAQSCSTHLEALAAF